MKKEKISILGAGLMGSSIAKRLISKDYKINVYNRNIEKANDLKTDGANIFSQSVDAIAVSDFVLITLTDINAINDVLFASNNMDLSGKTIIQMSTISPDESVYINEKINEYKGRYIECPVLGSKKEVSEGNLIMMVGSDDEEDYKSASSILNDISTKHHYIGKVGKAAALKLSLNLLIAVYAIGFSTSIGILEKNEVDVDQFASILRESSLFAPMLDKKLDRWKNRDYSNPNFPVKHFIKDIGLIHRLAEKNGISAGIISAIANEFVSAKEKGLGDYDYSAVFNSINNLEKLL